MPQNSEILLLLVNSIPVFLKKLFKKLGDMNGSNWYALSTFLISKFG